MHPMRELPCKADRSALFRTETSNRRRRLSSAPMAVHWMPQWSSGQLPATRRGKCACTAMTAASAPCAPLRRHRAPTRSPSATEAPSSSQSPPTSASRDSQGRSGGCRRPTTALTHTAPSPRPGPSTSRVAPAARFPSTKPWAACRSSSSRRSVPHLAPTSRLSCHAPPSHCC